MKCHNLPPFEFWSLRKQRSELPPNSSSKLRVKIIQDYLRVVRGWVPIAFDFPLEGNARDSKCHCWSIREMNQDQFERLAEAFTEDEDVGVASVGSK